MNQRIHLLLVNAAIALAGCGGSGATASAPPTQGMHSVRHVVILLQENRSFNNLFMGFPGAETASSGPCAVTKVAHWCHGQTVALKAIHLDTGTPGFGKDIGHEHADFNAEYDHGRMDGFDLIRRGTIGEGPYAKLYPYSYVDRSQTEPYWRLAREYALADRMFFTDTAASFIAHQEIIAGTVRLNASESLTDEPDDQIWGCDAVPGTETPVLLQDGRELRPGSSAKLPFPCFTQYRTMADLLDAANVSWSYYVDSLDAANPDPSAFTWNGFDAIKAVRHGPDWKTHVISPNTTFFADVKAGHLSSVSWLIPSLFDSDHPASGCDGGPRWVTSVVNAIGGSRYWSDTAVVVLWDDWGGWYDSVALPQTSYTSLGFRVPMIVVSPFAKAGFVSHTQYDFGSVLKFVEEQFGLGSLHTSDASANSISDIFDFTRAPGAFQPNPLPPVKKACASRGGAGRPPMRAIIEHDGGPPD